MERTISVEEKIRRAEEIYQKRKENNIRPIAKVNVTNEKKDIRLLKRMIVQIIVCLCIYLSIYSIQKNQYIFSKDFTNSVKQILSYDTNFQKIYNDMKEQINLIFTKYKNGNGQKNEEAIEENKNEEKTEDNTEQQGIGGAEETVEESNEQVEEEQPKSLSQEEQDIQNIKNTTSFIKPLEGTITSKFGIRETATGNVPKNHTGTDIAANTGTIIKSATEGEVVLASEEGDYGKHLKIQIGEVSIIYAHCNKLYVKQGDRVVQGQEIAEVGSTGNSTGPHLHFEIRISERIIDPELILEL